MNRDSEDFTDRLLMDAFEGPVPDSGFCDSLMEGLPPRRRSRNWPLIIGAFAGAVIGWASLLHAPIIQGAWQDWRSGELSASAIVVIIAIASMGILALAWALAEVDDRHGPSTGLNAGGKSALAG